jgi:hypothetical protein
LHFQDENRRFRHGTITLIHTDGTKRPVTATDAGPTGFHLGTAGYYGWNDWVLGQWVGDLNVEGNYVADCDTPENARELHQLRDLLVRVEDPVGGRAGLGNAETFALGAFPERGLDVDHEGAGLGAGMLQDVFARLVELSDDIGCRGLLVHAESAEARDFYVHLVPECEPSPTDQLHLVLLMKDIRRTLRG